MRVFLTESQIEALLEFETRIVSMPDGETRSVQGTKIMWQGFDYIKNNSNFPEEKIAYWAMKHAKANKIPFDYAYKDIVAFSQKVIRNRSNGE